MSYSRPNASAATGTKNLYGNDYSPLSGMCVTCIEGCNGLCEVGKSSYRGSEVIYPTPFGQTTSASQKDIPIDYSHFNIMGSAFGAYGIESDSDKAIFTNVDLQTRIGKNKDIKLKLPIVIPGLGSTDIAKNNWDGLAIGSAISGVLLTIGENVSGVDPDSRFEEGKVIDSPELRRRVKLYRDWQEDGTGDIVVQANVEDTRFGVLEYAIKELGVETVELKWGQGAKNIGGEIKINDLNRAMELKRRGYIVLPDPLNPYVQKEFKHGDFKEFERHSRIGMVNKEEFLNTVEKLRNLGAKRVFLKTGAYRPSVLARAIKYSSDAEIDFLTIDGAGGGTGMSPWRMMNEWGIPTVYLQCMAYNQIKMLADKGRYVPDIAVAGGFVLEDQMFKGISLGAPYVKAIGMARSPITAAMVGKTISKKIKEDNIPKSISKYGDSMETVFIEASNLKNKYNSRFKDIPGSAIGVITYFKRLEQGLKQLLCGARKFSLELVDRDDIVSLTREASEISDIPYVMDLDNDTVNAILKYDFE